MRLLLRCLIVSFILTLVIAGWILFVPLGSGIAFALLFPAFWLTSTVIGPAIATSDSGPTNFIAVVLVSSMLNVVLYAGLFFALFKISALVRRRRLRSSPL